MKLREYLFYNQISVTDFSKQIECSRAYLSGIIHGTRTPSKRLAKDIEAATNGKVKIEDLLGEEGESNG